MHMKQAVHQTRTADLDIVGEIEALRESAFGDAAMQKMYFWTILRRIIYPPGNSELIVFELDIQIGFGESRNGHRDTVGTIAGFFDIVGRIAGTRIAADCVEKPPIRSKPTEFRSRGVKS